VSRSKRAVVLGVGNILLSDEGIGVHAVNALEARYEIPAEVEIIDGGTSAMDCLDRIAEADFLLIADCVRGGREPGSLVRLGDGELQAFFRTRISPHQGPRLPPRTHTVGDQEEIGFGDPVETIHGGCAAVDDLNLVRDLIMRG
jgi:hypothetical protein